MRRLISEVIRSNGLRVHDFVFVLVIFTGLGGAAWAQTAAEPWVHQDAYIRKLVAQSRSNSARLRSDFKSALSDMPLSATQRRVADRLNEIDIAIDETDMKFTGVGADIENGRRKVIVPAGFLLAMDMVNRAAVEAAIFSVPQEKLRDYLIYAQGQLQRFRNSEGEGNAPQNLQRFCRQAELDCDSFDRTPVAAFYGSTLEAANMAGLAFVLGHEFAHHILGHLTCSSIMRFKEEAAADLFGLRLALKSKRNPIYPAPGIGAYLVLFAAGRDTHLSPAEDDYPDPLCRYSQSLRQAIVALDTDADFQGQLRQFNLTAMWQQIKNYMPNFERYTGSCNFPAHESSLDYICPAQP
ncbi:MAG: hypothetical protein WBX25_23310 [Rhodomicrobium sp.]